MKSQEYEHYTYCSKCRSLWYKIIVGNYCPKCKTSAHIVIYEGQEDARIERERKVVEKIFVVFCVITFAIIIFGIVYIL